MSGDPQATMGLSRETFEASKNQEWFNRKADCQLSLCMIVKNEEKNLSLCLGSFRPWVGEFVVVDTGSTDRTKELALAAGARVFDFPWIDDFAAARNFSLAQAAGKWVVWADADDTIGERSGEKMKELSFCRPDALRFAIQDSGGEGGDNETFMQIRMWPNFLGVKFEFPVHEQVSRSVGCAGLHAVDTGIMIFHTGYSDNAAKKAKRARNRVICEAMMAEVEKYPFTPYYIAQDYLEAGDDESLNKAQALYEQCIRLTENDEEFSNICMGALIGLTKARIGLCDYKMATDSCVEALQRDRKNIEALFLKGDLHYAQGDIVGANRMFAHILSLDKCSLSLPASMSKYRAMARVRMGEIEREILADRNNKFFANVPAELRDTLMRMNQKAKETYGKNGAW